MFLPVRFYWVRRARWLRLHPGGMPAFSRGLSSDTPGAPNGVIIPTPAGVVGIPRLALAPLLRCYGGLPGISLRSTPG